MIGTFGDIVFTASREKVFTFDRLSRRGSANFARHDRLGAKPVLEFTGPGLDEISLTIRLSVALGVEPQDAIDRLVAAKDAGREKALIIGGRLIGNYVITEITDTWDTVTARGRLIAASAALTLLEAAA